MIHFSKPQLKRHKQTSKIKFKLSFKKKEKISLDRIFYICLKRWKFVQI